MKPLKKPTFPVIAYDEAEEFLREINDEPWTVIESILEESGEIQ